MLLNVLAVGDVCGEGGQDILARRLKELREAEDIHFTVVNGENASVVGITPRQARGLYDAGADVITLGNHTWNRIQIADFLEKDRYILRPANYAGRVPGRGFGIYDGPRGLKIGVINLMGRLELNANLDSPFRPPARRGPWPGTWTGGWRPSGAPTPTCPRRTGRSSPRGPGFSPTWG